MFARNFYIALFDAAAVETKNFAAESLAEVAAGADELGQLARVSQHMAGEVSACEQRLKQQAAELRLEVDKTRKTEQVSQITDTDYSSSCEGKPRICANCWAASTRADYGPSAPCQDFDR